MTNHLPEGSALGRAAETEDRRSREASNISPEGGVLDTLIARARKHAGHGYLGSLGNKPWIAQAAADHVEMANLLSAAPPISPRDAEPIPMILHCPACGLQHIDEPDERTPDWSNPPHRSHLCHGCGHIWRPADVPTTGVAAIQTKGKADSLPPISPRGVSEDDAAFEARAQADWIELKREWGPKFAENTEAFRRGALSHGLTRQEMATIERGLGTKRTVLLFFSIGAALSLPTGSGPFNVDETKWPSGLNNPSPNMLTEEFARFEGSALPTGSGEGLGEEPAWGDLKVAFACDDPDPLWAAREAGQLTLPQGWELNETDGAGARWVAVFRVDHSPTYAEGEIVAAQLAALSSEAGS